MKSDPRDYKLDIRSQPIDTPTLGPIEHDAGKPFLQVFFGCCQVYLRVYLSKDGLRYAARCPKCMRSITFRVGRGGTDQRTFVVE
jgi:hypothetical protein